MLNQLIINKLIDILHPNLEVALPNILHVYALVFLVSWMMMMMMMMYVHL